MNDSPFAAMAVMLPFDFSVRTFSKPFQHRSASFAEDLQAFSKPKLILQSLAKL